MYILRNSLIFLCLILFASSGFSEVKKDLNEPIVITSQSLINDNKAKTATFDGNVIAKKGDVTLNANKMIVYYEEEEKGGNIKMIEAVGNVKLQKSERLITAHKATYLPEPDEKVIFTGEPRVTEGKNLITGEKITYFLKDDKAVVEKSKVYLKERKSNK